MNFMAHLFFNKTMVFGVIELSYFMTSSRPVI